MKQWKTHTQYRKTIACAIKCFKKYNLNALLINTNVSGRSAFNRCERLKKADLILKYDHFGPFYIENCDTIKKACEIKIVEKACAIFSSGIVYKL